jgi:acyl carrier protein
MTTATTTDRVREVLHIGLGTPLEGIDNPSRDEIGSWDSLAHIEVVFMVEENFGVRFSETEIAAMRSLHDFVKILQDKHAA